MAYLQLPNGSYLEIPEGMSPEDAYSKAQAKYPQAFKTESAAPKKGVAGAFGKGVESLLSSAQTTGETLFGDETQAAERALARKEKLGEKYADEVSLDKLKKAYEDQGLLAAGKELVRQVPIALAEQAPNIGSTIAGARLGAVGGAAFGGVGAVPGAVIGAGLGALAPSLIQQFGGNVERQAETQREAGQPININKTAALAAAVPQAGLDVASSIIPLGGKLAGKLFGPQVEKMLARGGTEAAEKLANESFKKSLAKGLGTGLLAEIPTEIAQQVLERAQAGLDLTSPDALQEYVETAYQVGLLAPMGAAGRFTDKSAARTQVAADKEAADLKVLQEQQAAKEQERLAEEAKKQIADQQALTEQQQKTGQLFGEPVKKGKADVSQLTVDEKEQERAELAQSIPQAQQYLKQVESSLNTAIKGGDTDAYKQLSTQHEQLTKELTENSKRLVDLGGVVEAPIKSKQELEQELNRLKRDFSKYDLESGAYDKAKLDAISSKIDDVKGKLDFYNKAPTQQGSIFDVLDEQDKQAQHEAAVKQAEVLTTPQMQAAPATEEDVAAYKEGAAKVQKLRDERTRLQGLFDTANSNNDIRAAVDLKKLIAQKDAEIKAALGEKETKQVSQAPVLEEFDSVAETKALAGLRDDIKKLDDRLKAAAGSTRALEKNGELTAAGEKLASVQQERDQKVADLARRQEILDQYTAQQGAEATTTGAIAKAFPTPAGKAGPDVDVIGSMAALRQQVGTGVGLRGELMGLRRQLQEARAARNKHGKGVDREAVSKIINKMRAVTEQLQDQDKVSGDIPIPDKLPERTKKYYAALNTVRAKQRKALATYMDALESLHNREYIGGATKKAKVTKQILEKRVNDAEIAFSNTMLEEVAIHRRVTGALPLTEKREETIRNQYAQALKDVRKLAEGTLAAPESARAVIAEQIADITHAATVERAQKTKIEPLLKTQFGKPEPEAAPTDIGTIEKPGLTAREREEGKKVDVSNVGVPEQGELFGAKEVTPTATVRATHKNFMRFVGIQASKFKSSLRAAETAITKAKGPIASLPERIRAYRLRIGEYSKTVQEVLSNVSEEASAAAKAEVKRRANEIRKETLALNDAIYGTQLSGLENTLKTLSSDLAFFKRGVSKMQENKTQHAANRKIHEIEKQIDSIKNQINNIYESYETALEAAPIKEENRLFQEYLNADPVLASVKATMERKRASLDKMLKEHDENLNKAAAERRMAEPKEEIKEVTPEERAQEQRLLEGVGLSGLKVVEGTIKPVLSKEQKVSAAEEAVSELSRKNVAHAYERAETKRKNEEVRAKEAKERKGYEKQINELRDQYEALDPVKDSEARLKLLKEAEPLFKRYRALTPIPRIPADERKNRARGPATKDVHPPQFKTGVKAAPKTRVEAQNKYEADIAEAVASERDFDYSDTGLSAASFDDIVSQINESKYRAEDIVGGKGLSGEKVKGFIGNLKLPKGLKVVVLDKLNLGLATRINSQGVNPDTVRGGVLPDGSVFIVAGNHADIKDLQKTLAHEITGHLGVEQTLGEAGMNALIKKIGDKKAVMELAEKLGVGDDAMAAYAAAKRIGKTEEQALGSAVREMIAHTEEARLDKGFLAKAGEFIKAMVGAVRAALRKMGVDLDISTNDIFKILRDARKDFDAVAPGAYVNKDGDIMFRSKPAVANAEFADVLRTTDSVVAKDKATWDRIKGEATGLIFRTKYVDRFAPIEKVFEKMRDSLKATQVMYYLRMHDQRMAWTSEVASNGPAVLEKRKRADGQEEYIIESKEGPSLKKVAEALRAAQVGNSEATNRVFTLYLLAKRAKRVGLDKLNFSGEVTEKMLADAMRAVEGNKPTKAAFENAANIYNEYNKGLVNFAVQTGAISKETAANMLKSEDYVPFYRQNKDGVVLLEVGGAPAIKIGNVKDQPYLHELVGGDKPVLDVFTSSLQNTSLLTDMALRNLATRNTAYSLHELGLTTGAPQEGEGPKAPTTIRFKRDGKDYFAIVNSEAAGVPSELLVKGMEGVNTALPNIVKMMNVPANLLRKWVTRNPAYALRQVVRDPLNAVMVSGADTMPVASSLKEIYKMVQGKSEGEPMLQRRGILGGQVLTGTTEDQKKILNDILSGKKGWDSYMAKLDELAIQGDAATRVVMYNSFIKQGLSDMEATLATLEAMNFSKRGTSPSLFAVSTMIPFMNAQIQGLNVLYQAFTGKMPFNEKLKVKQKLMQRGMMMAAFTLAYAAAMQDDEGYGNATDDQKYGNWFIPTPFFDEALRVPIPFELGIIFKAVPEALFNTMMGDEKAVDAGKAILKQTWNAMPNMSPQGIKPLLEASINHSFFTGREIDSKRLQQYEPGERYDERTSEISKLVGSSLGISPNKIDYVIRGYTGSLPLAIASLANPVLGTQKGEAPEGRASEMPLFGGFFQPVDASGLVGKAYETMDDVNQAKQTFKKMVAEGREAEAQAYSEANADLIAMGSMAGGFRKKMGELSRKERLVRSDSSMSAGEKRQALDEIRQTKIALSKNLTSARE